MIKFHCNCGQALQAPAGSGGKLAACPACKHKLRVPLDPDAIMARCPKCGQYVEREAFDVHVEACHSQEAPTEARAAD
jgi:Zn finger protein HypA/HybF involved in hydrogenase expression